MNHRTRRFPRPAVLGLVIAVVVAAAPIGAPATPPDQGEGVALLRPTVQESKTSSVIVDRLSRDHYRRLAIDDGFSGRLFADYLDYLDPSHSYFLRADVREFQAYRFRLDDALKSNDLDPAFTMFNRLQVRVAERFRFLLAKLEEGIDKLRFDLDESVEFDRKNAPWPASIEEANDLWRRRLKDDVLRLRLAGKKDEDIATLLGKRYRNRLHRVDKMKGQDAFVSYLWVFLHEFDPHTEYFPPQEAENFDIQMRLSFEGIGALLQTEDDYTKVVRIIPGGPAERDKRLQPGDRIVGVGQDEEGEIVDVIGWRIEDVVDLIRGPKGTVVRLGVLPASQTTSDKTTVIDLRRDTVKLEEQAAKKRVIETERDGKKFKVGVIRLPAFYIDFRAARAGDPDYRSSTRDVRRLIGELEAEKIDALAIDLRNNGGGSLAEARQLTGLFLRRGPIVQVRDARGRVQVLGDDDGEVAWDGPLAVLVNRLSASASEIFAGAIQDYHRGVVVGSRTFGKGTVQVIAPLSEGQIKFTQAKFYRVSGASTQKRGVTPDISFPEIYDSDQYGESALDHPMPWDLITPVRYPTNAILQALLPALRTRHDKRVADDPDFEFFRERLVFQEEVRARKSVSLNEAKRRKQQEADDARWLAIVNKRRKAKGLEPLKGTADAGESNATTGEDEDPYARETAEILHDLVALKKERFVHR